MDTRLVPLLPRVGLRRLLSLVAAVMLLHACCTAALCIRASAKPLVVIIKSRDNPFYTPAEQGFITGLKQHGYRNGDRVEIHIVALTGVYRSDEQIVRDQLNRRPALCFTLGTDATHAVAEQKPGMPVLFSMILDPVSIGVVKSLAEPGGGFTGTTMLLKAGKQIDTLLQACHGVHHIGLLYTESNPTSAALVAEARKDAEQLSIAIVATAIQPPEQTREALTKMKGSVEALWLIPDPASTGVQEMKETLDFARQNHLPVLGASSATVHAGALVALSPDLMDLGVSTAEMAAQLLDGTDTTAKMRVRGPRRVLLSVNLDAARALGIKFPDTMLNLADEVVDSSKQTNQP